MRVLLFAGLCALVGACGTPADAVDAVDAGPAAPATIEAFVGWWRIDSQVLTKNECPFKDGDFLRPEVVDAYLELKKGDSATLVGQECETADPASCNPDYNTEFQFIDGKAVFDQNRIRDLEPAAGFECQNHQRDLHTITVDGDVLTATTETFVNPKGPDCAEAEKELQKLSGKSDVGFLEGCDIVWLLKATRQP